MSETEATYDQPVKGDADETFGPLPGRWEDVSAEDALTVLRAVEKQHFAYQKRFQAYVKGARIAPNTLAVRKIRRLERAFYLAMRSLQKARGDS